MSKFYCRAILDFGSGNNAYAINKESKIPTKVEFCRMYSGKSQKGCIEGHYSNNELQNIIYFIKRGYSITEIKEQFKTQEI